MTSVTNALRAAITALGAGAIEEALLILEDLLVALTPDDNDGAAVAIHRHPGAPRKPPR